jgi:hypothetical protein
MEIRSADSDSLVEARRVAEPPVRGVETEVPYSAGEIIRADVVATSRVRPGTERSTD